jgi:heme exporter protein D
MMQFLEMGGYAAYVWPAYGITLATLLVNVWWARRRNAAVFDRVRRAVGRERTAAPRPTVRTVQ